MRGETVSKRRWRTIAVLAVGIAIGTTMMATPASSHVGGTVAHLVGHLKAYFWTKSQSDNRYVNVGEKAGSATEADHAADADHADQADFADSAADAAQADFADSAGDAQTLDGKTWNDVVPPPPPPPYNGIFNLEIEGSGTSISLASLAGCSETTFLVVEDCYLTFNRITPALLDWLDATANGADRRVRDLTIRRFSGPTLTHQLQVADAFIVEAHISDVDAAVTAPGSFTLAVVPESVEAVTPTTQPGFTIGVSFQQDRFELAIDTIDSSSFSRVLGVGISVQRIPTGGGSYVPGEPSFEIFEARAAAGSNTVQDLVTWATGFAQGGGSRLDGTLTFSDPTETLFSIDLLRLAPQGFVSPFPLAGGQSLRLQAEGMGFALPPSPPG